MLKRWSDAFELWCWRRLLRVPWSARRSNQSILKEISPEYSLEGLMLKLKLPILWPPDVKNWLIGKDPGAGKDWRQKAKGTTEDEMVGWHHRLDGLEFEQASGVGDGQGGLVCCSHGVVKSWTWLSDWTDWIEKKNLDKELNACFVGFYGYFLLSCQSSFFPFDPLFICFSHLFSDLLVFGFCLMLRLKLK